jgi:hypothetical protein
LVGGIAASAGTLIPIGGYNITTPASNTNTGYGLTSAYEIGSTNGNAGLLTGLGNMNCDGALIGYVKSLPGFNGCVFGASNLSYYSGNNTANLTANLNPATPPTSSFPANNTPAAAKTTGNNLISSTAALSWNPANLSSPAGASDFNAVSGTNLQGNQITVNSSAATGNVPVVFDLMDSASSPLFGKSVMSSSLNNTTSYITVPVGIFGVDEAWTMLNDEYGMNNNSYVTVVFNFGTTSNGCVAGDQNATTGACSSSSLVSEPGAVYNLTEGNQIDASMDCTTLTNSTCSGFATTTTSANTFNVFSGTYSQGSTGTGNTAFANSAGNIQLDGQTFSFGSQYTNLWLVSMTVIDYSGSNTSGTLQSRVGLTALTVDEVTPEPSTWFLMIAGIGALAFARYRLRRA